MLLNKFDCEYEFWKKSIFQKSVPNIDMIHHRKLMNQKLQVLNRCLWQFLSQLHCSAPLLSRDLVYLSRMRPGFRFKEHSLQVRSDPDFGPIVNMNMSHARHFDAVAPRGRRALQSGDCS